jgi:thiamine-phosphate pyrophosphorylase
LPEAIEQAVDGGIDLVILREKDLSDHDYEALAKEIRALTLGKCLMIVHSRFDIAARVGADGVHLSEDDVHSVVTGHNGILGRSVHSLASAQKAVDEGVDYLIYGTLYETVSKPGRAVSGPGILRHLKLKPSAPVLGIGGINAQRVGEVLNCGASGVAVSSAILGSPDPLMATKKIKEALVAQSVC